MRKLLIVAGLLTAVSLMLPGAAVSQGKVNPKNVKQEVTTEEDYGKLATKYKDGITDKITTFDGTAKSMTFKVEYQTAEPLPPKPGQENKGNQQLQQLQTQQQQLAAEYQRILNHKNAAQRQRELSSWQNRFNQWQQRYQKYVAANKGQMQTVTHAKEFDLDIEPDVRVVRQTLPMEYDDKGNVKEYTKEELKKLRDKDLPKYFAAKFEDVQPGQTVTLLVARPKPAKKDKDSDGKKEKVEGTPEAKVGEAKQDTEPKKVGAKGDEKGAGDAPPPRPTVRTIIIVADPDPADIAPKKGKRKKD